VDGRSAAAARREKGRPCVCVPVCRGERGKEVLGNPVARSVLLSSCSEAFPFSPLLRVGPFCSPPALVLVLRSVEFPRVVRRAWFFFPCLSFCSLRLGLFSSFRRRQQVSKSASQAQGLTVSTLLRCNVYVCVSFLRSIDVPLSSSFLPPPPPPPPGPPPLSSRSCSPSSPLIGFSAGTPPSQGSRPLQAPMRGSQARFFPSRPSPPAPSARLSVQC